MDVRKALGRESQPTSRPTAHRFAQIMSTSWRFFLLCYSTVTCVAGTTLALGWLRDMYAYDLAAMVGWVQPLGSSNSSNSPKKQT